MSSFALAFHLMKIVAPFNLSPLYPLPNAIAFVSAPFGMAATVVAAISLILGFRYRRWPGVLAVWLCYAALVLPTAGILPFGPQIAADRYTYLDSIAVSILAGAAVLHLAQKTPGRRNTAFTVYLGAGVVLVTLAILAGGKPISGTTRHRSRPIRSRSPRTR